MVLMEREKNKISFRDDMKEITKREIEIVDHRTNLINEEEYELLYNYTFSIIKERLAGIIKNRYIHYDAGFLVRKILDMKHIMEYVLQYIQKK